MARLTRLVLMLGCALSLQTAAPSPSQAGLIPWVYDSIFGPVGSVQARRIAYANYRSNGASAGYAPTTLAYAPVSMASSGGCSSCNQSSYYQPYAASYQPYSSYYQPYSSYYGSSMGYDAYYGGYSSYSAPVANYGFGGCNSCSSCGGGCSSGNCGTGNCATGNCSSGTCTNCSANSPPVPGYVPNATGSGSGSSTSGYGSNSVGAPVPDPNNTRPDPNYGRDQNTRDLNYRLNELEHRLNEDEKFLRRQHKNDYQVEPYNRPNATYETVPPRRKSLSIDSNPANPDNYERPIRGRGIDPAPTGDPLEEERRKPDFSAPNATIEIPSSLDDSANFKEVEPQTLRMLDRATSQAVAPRSRMQIVTKQSKTTIAKSVNQPLKASLEIPRSAELARN